MEGWTKPCIVEVLVKSSIPSVLGLYITTAASNGHVIAVLNHIDFNLNNLSALAGVLTIIYEYHGITIQIATRYFLSSTNIFYFN